MASIDEIDEFPSEQELSRRREHLRYIIDKRQLHYYWRNRERIIPKVKKYNSEHKDEIRKRKYRPKVRTEEEKRETEKKRRENLRIKKLENNRLQAKKRAKTANRAIVTPKRLKRVMKEIVKCRANEYINENNNVGKKNVLCLVGKTGVGKTLAALHLKYKLGANVVCTYTDRPPLKSEVEGRDHHFIDIMPEKDEMVVKTTYGGYKYYALKGQLFGICSVIVIDEKGLLSLMQDENDKYDVTSVLIRRQKKYRMLSGVDAKMMSRDRVQKIKTKSYDYVVDNDGTKKEFFDQIENIYKITCRKYEQ